MARGIAPDKGGVHPNAPKGNGGGNGGGGGGRNNANTISIPAFLPGQLGSLATDLNAGFGGGVADWKSTLRDVTAPMTISLSGKTGGGGKGNGGGNGGGNNNNGGGKPNDGGDGGGGSFEPSRPRNKMAGMMPQMEMPQIGAQTQGFLNVPGMMAGQRVPPTMGLLGRPMQPQQAQLPPEILSMLSRRR